MKKKRDKLTFHVDPALPAVYVYLREVPGFRVSKTLVIDDTVNVDFNRSGDLIGVEMLGPESLDIVLKTVAPRYRASELKQLAAFRATFDCLFQAPDRSSIASR